MEVGTQVNPFVSTPMVVKYDLSFPKLIIIQAIHTPVNLLPRQLRRQEPNTRYSIFSPASRSVCDGLDQKVFHFYLTLKTFSCRQVSLPFLWKLISSSSPLSTAQVHKSRSSTSCLFLYHAKYSEKSRINSKYSF